MRFEDLAVGQTAEMSQTVTDAMVRQFAEVTGDRNPVHLDDAYARSTSFGGRIAHGMLTAGFVSACMATKLPGPGAIYLSQSLRFVRPVRLGDVVTVQVAIVELTEATRRVRLATTGRNQAGKVVLDGEATVMVPATA